MAPDNRPGGGVFTLRDLLITGAYHRRIILFTFLLVMLLGLVGAQLAPRTFEADGRLIVLAGREGGADLGLGLPAFLSMEAGRTMEAELEVLRSRQVMQDTVVRLGADRLYPTAWSGRLGDLLRMVLPTEEQPMAAGWTDGDRKILDAATRLARDIRVAQPANSNIVSISYAHPDRRVATELVDTIMLTYLSRRQELFEELRSPFLVQEVERYREALRQLEQDIQQVKIGFNVIDLTQEILLAVNQIDSIEQRRRNILERRQALVAEVITAQTSLEALSPRVFDYQETTDRTDNDEARNRLLLLRVERASLRERYADDYPRLREIEEEIAAIQQFSAAERPNYTSTREVRNPAAAFLTNHLLTLQIEQEAVERQVEELDRQEERARGRIVELRQAERQLGELERSREVLSRVYNEYSMQAESARIEEDALRQRSSNVRVIDWAEAPLRSQSMALNFTIAGLFGGLLFGALAGLGAAWNRQVFVLPSEAERALSMPLLAVFNFHQETPRLPGSPDEVAFLATRILDHREAGQPLASLQFLSADTPEVRRKLVRAVARELAESHGRRTLLLDLEGQRSEIDPLLKSRPGTASQTIGGVEVAETEIPGLWVSRAADRAPIGQTRTERSRLRDAVEALEAAFDIVVVDVPNYGISHLGLRIGPTLGATVLVIRAEVSRSPVVSRLRDEVLEAGGDILGAVITGRRFHLPKVIYRWL